ncbi:MAG: alpha/beta hydrolase [Myxococcota bacterium]
MDFLSTLRFVRSMLFAPDREIGEPVPLDSPEGPIEADAYRPSGTPWGSVILLHGLALRGHRDPRLVRLGWALADCGIIAIAPRIPSMAELRLHPLAWPTIAHSLRAVAREPSLRGPGGVGIFAPSYAGGQALLAAVQPDIHNDISALMLVGAYADGRALLRHVMAATDADPYGRLILVRHALEATGDLSPGLAQAIDGQLVDLGLEPDPPKLPTALEQMPEDERTRFLELRDDVQARRAFAEEVLARHGEAIDTLSVTDALQTIEAPVAMLHGSNDPVIPSSESTFMYEALRRQGKATRLCITRLLDHGNVTAKGRSLLDLPKLMSTFGFWFSGLRR